jgi:hypothetical protein
MPTPNTQRRLLATGTIALAAAMLAACSSTPPPPRGSSGGRIPTEASTPAEVADPRILPADYMAFADEASQGLIRDLPDVPAFHDTPSRITILFGDMQNETGIISSTEFAMVREKIKNNLLRSRTFNDNFRFLISRAQLDELRRREVNTPTDPTRFDEQHTYLLNGTMFRVNRGNVNMYLVTFQLVNFTTGEVVWLRDYESKQWSA